MHLGTLDAISGHITVINRAFVSGVTERLISLVPSVILGGLMTLGVVGATAKLAPKLRDLELNQLQ